MSLKRTVAVVTFAWSFDALDFMLLPLLSIPIMTDFNLSKTSFSLLISIGLLGTVIGGIVSGALSDIFGRKKMLAVSLIIYGVGTLLLAFSRNFVEAFMARLLIGFGLGSEWSTGMALVTEQAPPEKRGMLVAIVQSGWPMGVLLAITYVIFIYPVASWRGCFLAAILPALLTVYVIKSIEESRKWKEKREKGGTFIGLFKREHVKKTILALTLNIFAMFSYWMFWSWLPTFLYEKRGISVVKSAEWLITTQLGAWIGYITYGILQDNYGRRPTWCLFTAMEATLMLTYIWIASTNQTLAIALGLLLGYFTGFWSAFGALVSELFPTNIRGSALGFIFNAGRAINFVSPIIIAWLSEQYGWLVALSLAAISAYIASILVWTLPETKSKILE